MLVLLLPQGPALAGVDADQVIAELLPAFGASSLSDLTWASQTELYQWADEALKRLSHRAGVFVERDTTTNVTAPDGSYPVPAAHIDTIHVALLTFNPAAALSLRATTVEELAALDATWPLTSGAVERFSMDQGPEGFITIYRLPLVSGNLAWIFHKFPTAIQAGQTAIAAPSPIGDYLAYAMLGEARRKESEAAMPEVADHCDQMMALMEEVVTAYWGPGQ
jgi:hypothetical protein